MEHTKQNYLQMRTHYQRNKRQAEKGLEELDKEYIKANAEYPEGTKLRIDDYGKEKIVIIQKHTIDENADVQPVYVTLEGKAQFVHKPTIIEELK